MPEVTLGTTSGYLAVPAGPPPGPWPGVVVIHESWGLNGGPPRRLDEALTALNVEHEVKVYPGAGHSFMSPKPAAITPLARLARLDYHRDAAEDSWQRIFAFFGEHLGPEPPQFPTRPPAP
jgi:dienelactone hydrolase